MADTIAPPPHVLLVSSIQASLARGWRFYDVRGEMLPTVASVLAALTSDRVVRHRDQEHVALVESSLPGEARP